MDPDVARLLPASTAPSAHFPQPARASSRGTKMVEQAQKRSAQHSSSRPVHRTASWPPMRPDLGFEELQEASVPTQCRESPKSDLGPQSAHMQGLTAPSSVQSSFMDRQNLLRAPDSTDMDRLWPASSSAPEVATERMSPIVPMTSSLPRGQRSLLHCPAITAPPDLEPADAALRACCYSIPSSGTVTSIVVTDQADYLFVAFSSGAIRVFHIASGNVDPEDRFGYVLCYLGSSKNPSSMGKFVVHLQIGTSVTGGDRLPHQSGVSTSKHLFAAAKMGATRMIAVDLDSLRESQRSRGFITTAGGNIKLFSKSDSRLRGFTSMMTLEHLVISEDGESVASSVGSPFYRAKYRLLCGKGFGSFTVWDVTLSYLPSVSIGSQYYNELIGHYTDHWEVISTGSIGSPALLFGCFSTPMQTAICAEVVVLGVDKQFLKSYYISPTIGSTEASNMSMVGMGASRLLKPPCAGMLPCRVLCASRDGHWLFGGLDELIVYRYATTDSSVHSVLLAEMHYSLSTTESSNFSGRHLRQLDQVWCSNDGSYAIILCSDNAVLVYSLRNDVFGSLQGPCAAIAAKGCDVEDDWKGYISLWFQANDLYTFQFGLSVVPYESDCSSPEDVIVAVSWVPSWKNSDKSCGVLRFERLGSPILSNSYQYEPSFVIPSHVAIVGIGLNHELSLIEQKTISKCHVNMCPVCGDRFEHWKTTDILMRQSDPKERNRNLDIDSGNDESEDGFSDSDCETECADGTEFVHDGNRFNHSVGCGKRSRENNRVQSLTNFGADKRKKTDTGFSADSGEMVSSLISEYTVNVKAPSKVRNAHRSVTAAHATASDSISHITTSAVSVSKSKPQVDGGHMKKIDQLEAKLSASRQETVAARQELDMVVRKGDKRFKEEMRLRKEWNNKMSKWELDRAELISQVRDYREINQSLRAECVSALSTMASLSDKLKAVLRTAHPEEPSVNASSSSSHENDLISPQQLLRSIPKLFCVVCQSNTAEIVFSECGHLCLCFEHYTVMNESEADRGGLKNCPLCKKYNSSVVHVRGLYY